MAKALRVENLFKSYGDTNVIKGLSFEVNQGEIYALLGPNGAGKTTTLEMIEGLRNADSGKIEILGLSNSKDKTELLKRVGIQLQDSGLPEYMTVDEAIKLFSSIRGNDIEAALIREFDLEVLGSKKYDELSTGQKRRLNLFLAIAHKPEIVFLDEPTAGLDVESRKKLHNYIKELKKRNITIILSSHDMAEVEELADKVGIILNGKIRFESSPKELTAGSENLTKISIKLSNDKYFNFHSNLIERSEEDNGYKIYFTKDSINLVLDMMKNIKSNDLTLVDFRVEKPSLEETFIQILNSKMEVI